jgi:hypothetical protein
MGHKEIKRENTWRRNGVGPEELLEQPKREVEHNMK